MVRVLQEKLDDMRKIEMLTLVKASIVNAYNYIGMACAGSPPILNDDLSKAITVLDIIIEDMITEQSDFDGL